MKTITDVMYDETIKALNANMQILVRSPYSRYSEAMKDHAAMLIKQEAQRAKQH